MTNDFAVNRRVAAYILDKRLVKKTVDERWGVSPQVLSNVLTCKRKLYADEIIPLANALGVSVGYLLGEDEQTA